MAAPNGQMSGQAFKDAESDLSGEASRFLRAKQDPDANRLGDLYLQAQGTLRDWIARISPDNAAEIQAANASYARLLRYENAVRRGDTEGMITPANALAAIKQMIPMSQFSTGNALLQPPNQHYWYCSAPLFSVLV